VLKDTVAVTGDGGNVSSTGWLPAEREAVPPKQAPLAAYAGAATEVTRTGVAHAVLLVSVRRLTPRASVDAPRSLDAPQPFTK
jgi:hypothetical protein